MFDSSQPVLMASISFAGECPKHTKETMDITQTPDKIMPLFSPSLSLRASNTVSMLYFVRKSNAGERESQSEKSNKNEIANRNESIEKCVEEKERANKDAMKEKELFRNNK